MNIQGTIKFSGDGGYTFSGSLLDNAGNPTRSVHHHRHLYDLRQRRGLHQRGQYDFPDDRIIGLVSHGVFIGSSPRQS